MPDFDRILDAYEQRQTQLVDELVAELEASAEQRARLRMVAQLVQSTIHTFGVFEGDRIPSAEAGEVNERRLSASAPGPAEPVPGKWPDLTLRSLVDSGCPTVWQARLITLNLGLKRSMLISGEPEVGKSTFLNALIRQLAPNQRLVVIDEHEDLLPALQDCEDVSQIVSAPGSRARAAAFRKAAGMKPDWIVVRELTMEEMPAFVEALQGASSGIATMTVTQPDAPFNQPLITNRRMANRLATVKPLVLHLEKAKDGMPRTVDLLEVAIRGDAAVLIPKTGLT